MTRSESPDPPTPRRRALWPTPALPAHAAHDPTPTGALPARGGRHAILPASISSSLSIVLAVAVIQVLLYGQVPFRSELAAGMDLHEYVKIAAAAPGLSDDVWQPYAYRLFGPYLVGLLPVPEHVGFYATTVFLSITLAALLYVFLREFGISPRISALTAVLFALNQRLYGYLVWNYFQINDLLSLICFVGLFLALVKARWASFALLLFLGALSREVTLVMIPVALVYLMERKTFESQGRVVLYASAPALVAFVLVRVIVQPSGGDSLTGALAEHIQKLVSPADLYRLLINSFAPLTLIPLVFAGITITFFKKNRYMLCFAILIFVSTAFGGDNERLMAPAFVVFYLLIARIIEEEAGEHRGILVLMLLSGALTSTHHTFARYTLPDRSLTIVLTLGSLLVVTLACIALRYTSHGATAPSGPPARSPQLSG